MTGGAGLIGSHLVDLLIQKGYDVIVLDFLEPQTHPRGKPEWIHPKAHFIQGDMRKDSDLKQALEGVRFVFHQAAFGGFTEENSKYLDVNVSGTAKLFERIASRDSSVEKVVVASSQAVYGEGTYTCAKDGPQFVFTRTPERLKQKNWELQCSKCGGELRPSLTPEDKKREGESPYALSKEFEERLALFYGKKLGLPVVALRYAVTYGPRQSRFNPYTGVVSIFSIRLLNDLAPLIFEDGKQTRDFIYVGDIARANLFVMENESANGQVFNVGTGKPITVEGLANTLALIYGKAIQPEISGKFRWGDMRHLILDSSKLKKLGFSPLTSLKDGLARFGEWIRSQGEVKDYFSKAYERLKENHIVCG